MADLFGYEVFIGYNALYSRAIRQKQFGLVQGSPKISIDPALRDMTPLRAPTEVRTRGPFHVTKNAYSWGIDYLPCRRMSSPVKYDFRHFLSLGLNDSAGTAIDGAWTYATSVGSKLGTFLARTIYGVLADSVTLYLHDCKVGTMRISASVDEPVTIHAEGLSTLASSLPPGSTSWTAGTAVTAGSFVPLMWSDVRVYIDGSLATNIHSVSLQFDNDVRARHALGSNDPRAVSSGPLLVEGTLERRLRYDPLDPSGDWRAVRAGTLRSLTVQISDVETLRMCARNVRYRAWPFDFGDVAYVYQRLEFTAGSFGLNS